MYPSLVRLIAQKALLIPWLMIGVRFVIALVLILDALDRGLGPLFFPAIIIAMLLDVGDGMLARRLGVASLALRRADSFVDITFFYAVALAAWLAYADLLQPFLPLIALLVLLQLANAALALIKFHALAPYHTSASRFSGILMGLAAAQLFVLGQVGFLLAMALLVSCLSCLECIAITLTLPRLTADVPGFRHALRLRDRQSSRPAL